MGAGNIVKWSPSPGARPVHPLAELLAAFLSNFFLDRRHAPGD